MYIHGETNEQIGLWCTEFNEKSQRLQVSTGIFYLLISRKFTQEFYKIQKRRKSEKSSHPISTSFFYISSTSLCKSLCSLSLTSLYMCFYSGESSQWLIRLLFLFFVCVLFLSLHCVLALFIIYLSFCFNKCLCQISALLHLNTQHPTKRIVYIYTYIERITNRLAFAVQNSMKIVSVYKSLPEYSIC